MNRSHARQRQIQALVALAVMAALVVPIATTGGAARISGNRVLVIGDSLLNFSQAAVSNSLTANGWQAVVDGRSGSTIESWAPVVGPDASLAPPDVAVVELGTNDCNTTCDDLGPAIDNIVTQLIQHGAGVVLWLNVQTTRSPLPPGAPKSYPKHADYVDYAIEQSAVRWPQMHVVDLGGFFAGHPEWHLADGVHPNAAGEQALALLITAALHQWAPA